MTQTGEGGKFDRQSVHWYEIEADADCMPEWQIRESVVFIWRENRKDMGRKMQGSPFTYKLALKIKK